MVNEIIISVNDENDGRPRHWIFIKIQQILTLNRVVKICFKGDLHGLGGQCA